MWALRRASGPLRAHKYGYAVSSVQCTDLLTTHGDARDADRCQKNNYMCLHHLSGALRQMKGSNVDNRTVSKHSKAGLQSFNVSNAPFHCSSFSSTSLLLQRNLSSKTGAKSSTKESDLEDSFADLGLPVESDVTERNNMASAGEESEEDTDEEALDPIDLLEAETGLKNEEPSKKTNMYSYLTKLILDASKQDINSVLDKWIEEGNEIEQSEVFVALRNLRKRKLYLKALQFTQWLVEKKHLEFDERAYASHLDLIAKVHGIHRAEKFIAEIPGSFRNEVIYRTLLANSVSSRNITKSEEIYKKMRDLGLPITIFTCNQLLILYRRDQKKLAGALQLMENENIKPSLLTYRLLIDTKGFARDISGMEQIIEAMKADGVAPDIRLQAIIAKHYIFTGFKEKAEMILKDMECSDLGNNRAACKLLLPLYAHLDRASDVERIWKLCEPEPRLAECLAAVEAWGRVGNVENAEEVFAKMLERWGKLNSKYYDAMLKVYAHNKLLSKGKELVKKMSDSGLPVGEQTVDAIVKLYVESGEVEKADSILHKFAQQNKFRKPLYVSYLLLLEMYAKKGDIHNAEKIFNSLRQIGYTGRIKNYQLLLQAYINGKSPAYGFRERMKADNMVPNRLVAAQLATVDAFKSPISQLLE